MTYSFEHIAPLVWYIYDQGGNIVATLDDSHSCRPRSEEEMVRQARIMSAALSGIICTLDLGACYRRLAGAPSIIDESADV